MDDFLVRLAILLSTLVPFLFFMASVYLALHSLVASAIRHPDSQVLWFFGVVTGPLTRPVRRLLPPAMPEPRVRAIALAVYVVLWLVSGWVLRWLGKPGTG
jgi:uncharacterized protein YggT (Ycf19 family)